MKKLLFIALAVAGVALVSCDKNQQAVKKLDGEWEVTSMKADGVEQITPDFSVDMTFNACKLKKDEWCTGEVTPYFMGLGFKQKHVYRATGDGTTLEFKDDVDSTDVRSIKIDELSKSKFKGSGTLEFDGFVLEVETIEAEKK